MIDIASVQNKLALLAAGNEEYASFNKRVVNTRKNLLGVRVPDMRKLAKELSKQTSFSDIFEYLKELDRTSYEQVLLAGLIINRAALDDKNAIKLAEQYIKLADSWAEIDIFASKRRKFNEKLWWDFAVKSLASKNEFVVRYGIIEMMANYLNKSYIEQVFANLRSVQHDGYYVRMGMAWLYATAAINFYKLTYKKLKLPRLLIGPSEKLLLKCSNPTSSHPYRKTRSDNFVAYFNFQKLLGAATFDAIPSRQFFYEKPR